MSRDNSRTIFSAEEIQQIESLIHQLEKASPDKQKGIRGKIRRIGLYWSEVAPGYSYTVDNFHHLINSRIIRSSDSIRVVKTTETSSVFKSTTTIFDRKNSSRKDSDEYYVIGLCNEALGLTASQQHHFSFLLGDSGHPLPVDAYYVDLKLVVEYYEQQHTEQVQFFDRRMTVSGVSRGEQRKIYDERRRTELPKHGIELVILNYTDFGTSKKIARNHDKDLEVVRLKLSKFL